MPDGILNSMKIAILPLGHRALPTGGANIFAPGVLATQAAEKLTKRGYELDIFAPKDSIVDARIVSFGLESMFSRFGNLKKDDPNAYTVMLYQYEMFVAAKLIEKSGEYDVIHAHDYRKLMYFSRFSKCPIVYSYHGVPSDDITTEIDRVRAKEYYNDNYFIAASQYQIDAGKEYYNFIGTAPHGVDLDTIPFSADGGDSLLFVGRLMRRKRPDIAIGIAKDLGVPITVVGGSYPTKDDIAYYNETVLPLLDLAFVTHPGLIPYPDIYNYYSKAKALIFPIEEDEAFGMVMIEAMAAGTPVVSFDRGPVSEIVEDGVTGFVVPDGDIEALKNAAKKIIDMSAYEYAEMRRACRARVKKKYTIDTMVDGYLDIYKKAIDLHSQKHLT